MKSLLRSYSVIEKPILYVIIAEFFLQLINSTFLAILPLYMDAEKYSDPDIGNSIKFRYLGVLVLSIFLGMYIRGRRLRHLFTFACIFVPLFGLGVVYTVGLHQIELNHAMQIMWGISFTFMQIPVLPFILRNSAKENHTAAISLSYATWSVATILSHALIAIMNGADPVLFNERNILIIFSCTGFISLFFIWKAKVIEFVPPKEEGKTMILRKDIPTVVKALIPTLIIAVGAGFTIPFISLFFSNVHHLSTSQFAALNLVAAVLVAGGSLLVPKIKESLGYKIAVPSTQSFAIIALVLMATTQFYSHLSIAVFIAMGCYLLRQPLMNLAGPMTTEIVMDFAGKRNREIMSALSAAIWSGSWYFSGQLFASMRGEGIPFVNIFLITAALYTVGVVWYIFLIRAYEKKT